MSALVLKLIYQEEDIVQYTEAHFYQDYLS